MNFQYQIAILVFIITYLSDILFLRYIAINCKTILLSVNLQSFSHFISIFSPGSCSIDCLEFVPPVFNIQRRQWQPTPVLLPGKSHGQMSLVGCSPWGREESDMTERLHFHFSLSCIGGGNGNPLQCSCLENPRDGGAWLAAVYGVAQSRTGLK